MLNRLFLLHLALLAFVHVSSGQADSLAARYAATIRQDQLREHLEVLASDAYQGRDTGKEGQKMAANYLRERFQDFGIPPLNSPGVTQGYYQPYELIEEKAGSLRITSRSGALSFPDEVVYFSEPFTGKRTLRELTIAKGELPAAVKPAKSILLDLRGQSDQARGSSSIRSAIGGLRANEPEVVFVALSEEVHSGMASFVHAGGSRMRLAAEAQARSNAGSGPQVVMLGPEGLTALVGRRKAARLQAMPSGARMKARIGLSKEPQADRVVAENVLAYIEGSDKKEELIIITAHYDHIGVENGVVYNGADDDGSGTVALLEIAEAFAKAKAEGHGPRRSVLVMPVSGEEKGLLGSRYYSEHPVFPLEGAVANLNIDMIGRTDSAHAATAPYVYIIGSDRLSTELHAINEQANRAHVGLVLDYTFNAEDDPNRFYYRSDHYNFARKGVPCIFYFSGVHQDYHQPGDDVEKIRFDLLEQRAKLVFHTAWKLANRPERIVVDKPVRQD